MYCSGWSAVGQGLITFGRVTQTVVSGKCPRHGASMNLPGSAHAALLDRIDAAGVLVMGGGMCLSGRLSARRRRPPREGCV